MQKGAQSEYFSLWTYGKGRRSLYQACYLDFVRVDCPWQDQENYFHLSEHVDQSEAAASKKHTRIKAKNTLKDA